MHTHVRWLIRSDLDEVLWIESQSFEHRWFEEDFIHCLRERNCIGMVAERDKQIVGYMVYELHISRLHLLKFAVAPDARRTGVGRAMIAKLIAKLSSDRRSRILLELAEDNMAAQLFFNALGFRATSVLRDFYEEQHQDAYLMELRYQAPVEPVNRIGNLAYLRGE